MNEMKTYYGKKVGFELRRIMTGRKGRLRGLWLVYWRKGGVRPASDVEIRLWRSLPNHMRAKQC